MDKELLKIVRECKGGSHSAFKVLFTRYYQVLLGVAMRYMCDRDEAKDVLQDAFIRIFNNINTFSENNSIEGWMKRIVQNTAINRYRQRLKFDNNAGAVLENSADDEFETMTAALNAKMIMGLLARLPEGYRTIINLFLIDGFSHNEIATMLGISPGTSKSQLFKARRMLKELLANEMKQYSA